MQKARSSCVVGGCSVGSPETTKSQVRLRSLLAEHVRSLAGRSSGGAPATVAAYSAILVVLSAVAITLAVRWSLAEVELVADPPALSASVEEAPTSQEVGQADESAKLRADLMRQRPQRRADRSRETATVAPEVAKQLQLQGIVGSDPPRAILLELQSHQTHTVSVGQRVGAFEVVEIADSKIILKWRDELFELGL